MKLVITGATGFIGSEVLAQAVAHADVISIISLSRRLIPDAKLPPQHEKKVKQYVLDDEAWTNYPDEVKAAVKDAKGWAWALGSTSFPDAATMRRVSIDYTMAALDLIVEQQKAIDSTQPVRFVYLSGALTERDQDKKLWIKDEFRKTRGQVENKVTEYSREHAGQVSGAVARPAGVMKKDALLKGIFLNTPIAIAVDQLAAWIINAAIYPSRKENSSSEIVENAQLKQEGARLLTRTSNA